MEQTEFNYGGNKPGERKMTRKKKQMDADKR